MEIVEKIMETTIVYWSRGFRVSSLCVVWDSGKENGSYYRGFRVVYAPRMENQVEKNMQHEMETALYGYA